LHIFIIGVEFSFKPEMIRLSAMITIPKTRLIKAEIAGHIAQSTGMTKQDVHAVIDALFAGVKTALFAL